MTTQFFNNNNTTTQLATTTQAVSSSSSLITDFINLLGILDGLEGFTNMNIIENFSPNNAITNGVSSLSNTIDNAYTAEQTVYNEKKNELTETLDSSIIGYIN